MLQHVFPRHSVQATEHSRPCFLQLQRFESQFVLHLQNIVFRSSSGASGKLDLISTHMLCSIDHPQSFASILSALLVHCFTWWNTRKIWKCAAFDVWSKNDAVNYRGITVLPVISKIVEAVIRDRIQPLIHNMQNPTQRGFTKGSSPMNAALPVEEAYRILTDEKQNGHLVLLDAKAALDKVIHSHLLWRMYHAGIQDKTWTIIKSLHHNAESCIKWAGSTSDCFKVGMGVWQEGILSTDLYKLYINQLLDRLQEVGIGLKIGNINVNNTGCADGIALLSSVMHRSWSTWLLTLRTSRDMNYNQRKV